MSAHNILPWVAFVATLFAGGFLLSYLGHQHSERLGYLLDRWWGIPIAMMAIMVTLVAWAAVSIGAGNIVWAATA